MDQNRFFQGLDQLFQTKNIQEIETYILDAMEKAQREGDVPALLAIANELGGVYRVTNRLEEAKKIYGVANRAIALLNLENTEQQGTTLLNLASVYSEGNELNKALETYERVKDIYRSRGLEQDYRMAALYNNMSHVYDKLNLQSNALDYAEKALKVIKAFPGHDVELATSYTTLGTRLLKAGRYGEAIEALQTAEKIFKRLPGKVNPHFSATLNAMGDVYYEQGKWTEAASCFQKALEIIKENYGENQSYEQVVKNLDRVKALLNGTGERVKGLALSESYFHQYGREMIDNHFVQYKSSMAMGLVGEGSECFGYDDAFSESHDFGPGFCIWLPEDVFQQIGSKLQSAYENLPKTFQGKTRMETPEGKGRVGVFSIEGFYKKYIGYPQGPKSNVEWLFTPETSLSTVTNGKIFADHLGEFTRIRNELSGFYPRDVYLKKLAARMALMSQSGQYNYERCMKRGEHGAAYMACNEFVKATVSMVYLLNRTYMPFYKWMFKGMEKLETLGEVKGLLEQLLSLPDMAEHMATKVSLMEEICIRVRDVLIRQGIPLGTDAFLIRHCPQVMSLISDPQIKNLPVMFDGK